MVQSILFTNVPDGKLTLLVGEDVMVKYIVEPVELQKTAVLQWTSSKESLLTLALNRQE